jgi:hypothetical protein
MSAQTIKLIVAALLFLHGLAHIGPIATYLWIKFRPSGSTDGWLPARLWLIPSLKPSTATAIASLLWGVSLLGFVGAAFSVWGILISQDLWRQIAIASAIVSSVGILTFLGTWPKFNTAAAMAVNVLVLVTQLWLRWPPMEMFGR